MKKRWVGLILLLPTTIFVSLLLMGLSASIGIQSTNPAEFLPTARPQEVCDTCEPNEDRPEACGPLHPGESYPFFIRCVGGPDDIDDDYYYIDVERPGTYTVDLTDIPTGTDYSVYLYYEDKSDALLECSSDNRGNIPEHATCHLSQAGRYYVRVYPWEGCSDSQAYQLVVDYPPPQAPPVPTPAPPPLCNVHIDDYNDSNPDNDLGLPSWDGLEPPGCGTFDVEYTGTDLQLDYDLTFPGECTARYGTTLSLDGSPYELLTFRLKGDAAEELSRTLIGLSDLDGHEMRVRVGDFAKQVVRGTWQVVGVPLAVFATEVDLTQLDAFSVELADTQGVSQGTIYLDNLRLETSLIPLTVDSFDDGDDSNALLGASHIFTSSGATLSSTYVTSGTHDDSAASYAITYTLPISADWALWETDLQGVDVSDYDFFSFSIKGAQGGEKVNLYLEDAQHTRDYVDVERYTAISTGWRQVLVPLADFDGVDLTRAHKVKFTFEWSAMSGTIVIDDLRFISEAVLIDNFCDSDPFNSLNGETGTYTSAPSCSGVTTPTLSGGALRLDYDVTAGLGCFAGYWSKTPLDLNPYRALNLSVKGDNCGTEVFASLDTSTSQPVKIRLSDYLLDGITDQWQEVRIPLAAYPTITDWRRGDAYAIGFEADRGSTQGSTWWDDVTLESGCAPVWVDNFNDEEPGNGVGGSGNAFSSPTATITQSYSIIHAYGDAGAGLVLDYTVPANEYAGWEAGLRNVDLSGYEWLVFDVKRTMGDGQPNIYLQDANDTRRFVNLETYVELSGAWQQVTIPLKNFGELDLSRIKHLQFVFEWDPQDVAGTLHVDNVRFACINQKVFLPILMKNKAVSALETSAAQNHASSATICPWNFETGTQGWTHQTYSDSLAVIAVNRTTFRAYAGDASLAMVLDLVGGDGNPKRQGDAFVDTAQLDLACKPLSCRVYVPTCGLGDPSAPNWIQLFVKDKSGKAEYGTLTRVVRNQWFEVALRPSTTEPHNGYMQAGFDPHSITQVGVKFLAGSEGATYRGKFYLDECCWKEIDPAAAVAAESCGGSEGFGQREDRRINARAQR